MQEKRAQSRRHSIHTDTTGTAPLREFFKQHLQARKEALRQSQYAELLQNDVFRPYTVVGLELVTQLIDLEAEHTRCYHLPAPDTAHIHHLLQTAPADPARICIPSTHLWIHCDPPLAICERLQAVRVLHFVKAFAPYMIPVIHKVYKGRSRDFEQQTQQHYAQQLGIWHLDVITSAGEDLSEPVLGSVLVYDATQLQWSYSDDSHSCDQCTQEKSSQETSVLIECAFCRRERVQISTWFATALAFLQENDEAEGKLFTPGTGPIAVLGERVNQPTRELSTAQSTVPAKAISGERMQLQGENPPALSSSIVTGVYQHPSSGMYQVWVTWELEELHWVSAHRFQDSAHRLSSLIEARRDQVQSPDQLQALLRLVACESEQPVRSLPSETERLLLLQSSIALQRPRFERTLHLLAGFLTMLQKAGESLSGEVFRDDLPLEKQRTWHTFFIGASLLRKLDNALVLFLDRSALSMCEALLAPDGQDPDLPAQPLWIQPLGPFWFRRQLLRGLLLSQVAIRPFFDRDPALKRLTANEREFFWQPLAGMEGGWHVYLVTDPNFGQQRERLRNTPIKEPISYLYASYASGEWTLAAGALNFCPTGSCRYETLGAGSTVVPCKTCQADLHYWSRWIKTMLWVSAGKFRRAGDVTPFETTVLHVPTSAGPRQVAGKTTGPSPRPRVYHCTTVSYDASYFKAGAARPGGPRGQLHERYLVLTAEEALAEGAMEIDLDGVLIRDFGAVRGYWRRRPGQVEKQYIAPKERRAQYVSLRLWKARQQAVGHRVVEVVASAYVPP